jgi:hypothetical protein
VRLMLEWRGAIQDAGTDASFASGSHGFHAVSQAGLLHVCGKESLGSYVVIWFGRIQINLDNFDSNIDRD